VVAALAVVNASGTLLDPSSGLPWIAPSWLRRPSRPEREAVEAIGRETSTPLLNTTIGVVATDAELTRSEAGRLAQSAHDGLARAIRPAHGLFDGDTIFGLATGRSPLPTDAAQFLRGAQTRAAVANQLFAAAADVFAVACIDAVLSATTIGGAPAYRDLCRTAYRRLEFA